MKLEVGMHVRTNKGEIAKIVADSPYLVNIDKFKKDGITLRTLRKIDILKASYSIIGLVECGDYVNGFKVYYCYCTDDDSTGLYINTEKGRVWLDKPSQIKSIVTKEQFSQMEYKVVE